MKSLIKKIAGASVGVVALLVLSLGYMTMMPKKALSMPGLPFGGISYIEKVCSCSCGATILRVTDPKGGEFMYNPCSTTVYQFGVIPSDAVWLLGDYFPEAGVCLQYSGYTCTEDGTYNLINYVGTSVSI